MARFDEVAGQFWDTTTTYCVLPPLTDELVAMAEKTLSVRLPRDLLTLLRLQNGGCVAGGYDSFPSPPNSWAEDHVPFESMGGIALPDTLFFNVVDTPNYVDEWGLPPSIVLLDGDGPTWVALDYRTCGPDGEPSIIWIDNELESELLLAPNFRSFVEGLAPTPATPDGD